MGKDLEVRFYDADTLQPAVAGVPPIDAELLERWRAGEESPGRMLFFRGWGRVASLGPQGPMLAPRAALTYRTDPKKSGHPNHGRLGGYVHSRRYHLACRLEEGADPLSGDPRVDLCALVDNVMRRFTALGRARGIAVHNARPDGEIWVRCNPTMAGQVLANLVHNAVAHGDSGGHVGIVLEATNETFTLMVIDDGPGMAPTELPRIGERTFRSDEARQRDPAGGGLGLAIVGEVCRRANLSLEFGHEVPRGLRVTVSGKRRPA